MLVCILVRNSSATNCASVPSRMIVGRMKMMSSERTILLVLMREGVAEMGNLIEQRDSVSRQEFCVSLINPASITVWPLAITS